MNSMYEPGREVARRRQGRAVGGGGGWKLVRAAILLADLDVEVVVLDVLGVDAHDGEDVAARVGTRVEQLRMVVATGVGGVIVPVPRCCSRGCATSAPPPRPPRGAPGPRRGRWRRGGLDGRAAGNGLDPAPGRARRKSQAGGWTPLRSSSAWTAPTALMRARGARGVPARPGGMPRPRARAGAATPMPDDTTPGPHQLPATARAPPSASDRLSAARSWENAPSPPRFARDNWNYRE